MIIILNVCSHLANEKCFVKPSYMYCSTTKSKMDQYHEKNVSHETYIITNLHSTC